MRTRDELFRQAQRVVAARRQQAVTQAENARRAAYAAHPEISAADDAHMHAGLALARLAAAGGNLEEARARLEQADAAVTDTARAAGYRRGDFEPSFTCPKCRDTGIVNGKTCSCVEEAARTLRREEINQASPLGLCKFSTFDVNRYPAAVEPELGRPTRDYMAQLLEFCQKYAEKFSSQSRNLLFMGTAGLGKTHLALAIADAVLDGGHDVLYTSSAALMTRLGREQFDRDADEEWLTACKEADLLILDDLGTEFLSAVTISALYELINTRMLTHRPTIYTTNITDQQVFITRYTEKVASRMLGNCKMFKFFGIDQRLK